MRKNFFSSPRFIVLISHTHTQKRFIFHMWWWRLSKPSTTNDYEWWFKVHLTSTDTPRFALDTMRCNFNEFIIAFGNGKVIFHRWSVFCCCFCLFLSTHTFKDRFDAWIQWCDDLRFDKKLMVFWVNVHVHTCERVATE